MLARVLSLFAYMCSALRVGCSADAIFVSFLKQGDSGRKGGVRHTLPFDISLPPISPHASLLLGGCYLPFFFLLYASFPFNTPKRKRNPKS